MRKTVVINLYAGPGAGKTTTATKLFGLLKSNYINCELIHEFVKEWVWEGKNILDTDQVLILANQHRKERLLYNKVDYIITDSPMWLVAIYEKELSNPPYIAMTIIEKFVKSSKDVEHVHVFLNRGFKYDISGRLQTEEEALLLDNKIKNFLTYHNIPFIEVDVKNKCENEIANMLKLIDFDKINKK